MLILYSEGVVLSIRIQLETGFQYAKMFNCFAVGICPSIPSKIHRIGCLSITVAMFFGAVSKSYPRGIQGEI